MNAIIKVLYEKRKEQKWADLLLFSFQKNYMVEGIKTKNRTYFLVLLAHSTIVLVMSGLNRLNNSRIFL